MDNLEQPEETVRELILNMSIRVNKIQAQGQMEAKRNLFFTFIKKDCEAPERNFEQGRKDVRKPEKNICR